MQRAEKLGVRRPRLPLSTGNPEDTNCQRCARLPAMEWLVASSRYGDAVEAIVTQGQPSQRVKKRSAKSEVATVIWQSWPASGRLDQRIGQPNLVI
jgi:hypothetical protein